MIFEIRRVKNGCILKVVGEDGSHDAKEVVYQQKYEENEDVECFADFLIYLNEEYGPSTGRHSEKRIYISVEPGDKFEPVSRK